MGAAASSTSATAAARTSASTCHGSIPPQAQTCPILTRSDSCPESAAGARSTGVGGAPRQRVAYRGPTLGGSLAASTETTIHAGSEYEADIPLPSNMLKLRTEGLARRGRSTLVTADGLVHGSDIESVVKQRRRVKKIPSASSLRVEQLGSQERVALERPGSAHARLAHDRALDHGRTARYALPTHIVPL